MPEADVTKLTKQFMVCVGTPIPINPADPNDKRMRLDSLDGQSIVAEIENAEFSIRDLYFASLLPGEDPIKSDFKDDTRFLDHFTGRKSIFDREIGREFDGVHSLNIASHTRSEVCHNMFSTFVPFKIKKLDSYSP